MDTALEKISHRVLLDEQKRYFNSGTTRDVQFRIKQLQTLGKMVYQSQDKLKAALKSDLGKPSLEVYGAEILPVMEEINVACEHLAEWNRPYPVNGFMDPLDLESKAIFYPEPLGSVLIIAPWNYPLQLLFNPLVGAVAAGNCCVIKPSKMVPHTTGLIVKLIEENFTPEYICAITGRDANTLMNEPFDHIFFTGSVQIGKTIMKAAAENLTPVTLELGGKSPCIVDQAADLDLAARRIVWGKYYNTGQTCVAPDYLLVHSAIKQPLLQKMLQTIRLYYGDNPVESQSFGRIVNEKQFQRLSALLEGRECLVGGERVEDQLYIAPTIVDRVGWDDPLMEDEIFGPILPVIEYDNLDDMLVKIVQRPKPLALYIFSEDRSVQQKIIDKTSYGGGCINDTISYQISSQMPFGGVGHSGMGRYHGKATFDLFTHPKPVLERSHNYDPTFVMPPYSEVQSIILRWMIRTTYFDRGSWDIDLVKNDQAVGSAALPAIKAPSITLQAIGSGKAIKLDSPRRTTVLVIHPLSALLSALMISVSLRGKFPLASSLYIANVWDCGRKPGWVKSLGSAILNWIYQISVMMMGDLVPDYLVFTPDRNGDLAQWLDLHSRGLGPRVVVINSKGDILGTYQGKDAAKVIYSLIRKNR